MKSKIVKKVLSNRFSSGGNYINYYSRLDKKPKYWHFLLLAPMQIIRFQSGFVRIFPRVVRALNLNTETLPNEKKLPMISLAVPCVEKDLYLLPQVLSNCMNHSENPISHISVIVPSDCKIEEIAFSSLDVPIRFIIEDDVIPEAIRIRLKDRFKDRYGWVLQRNFSPSHT